MPEGLQTRLRIARKALNLNASEMASAVGLSTRSTWERYERGKHIPNADILSQIAKLGIDIHWLVTGAGEMMREQGAATEATIPGPLDEDALLDAIVAIEEHLLDRNQVLDPRNKAIVISTLYQMSIDEREKSGSSDAEIRERLKSKIA